MSDQRSPSMREIAAVQNSESNMRRQLAKAHTYAVGNRWHFAGAGLAIMLALASPFVLLFKPGLGPLLGAVAGAWIFMSRILFEPIRQQHQLKGAQIQDAFDCDVLGLERNDDLVHRVADEEIRKASKAIRNAKIVAKQKDWYPTQGDCAWPRSVLICQRANSVWARRQHQSYGRLLIFGAALWSVLGILLAIVHGSALADYLTTVALPSLPAVLDATEVSKKHREASERLQGIEDVADNYLDSGAAKRTDLREIQDQLFTFRRADVPVPGWFYRIIRKGYEEDMRYAAKESAGRK